MYFIGTDTVQSKFILWLEETYAKNRKISFVAAYENFVLFGTVRTKACN